MATNTRWLIAMILLLPGMEALGDEPATPSAVPAPERPKIFGRIHDRWVRRTRAVAPSSVPAAPPEIPMAPPREIPPDLAPIPAGPAGGAQGRPAAGAAPATGDVPPQGPPGASSPTRAAPATPAPVMPPTAAPATPPALAGPSATAGAGLAVVAPTQPEAAAPAIPGPGEGQVVTEASQIPISEPATMLGDMSPITILEPLRGTSMASTSSTFPPHHIPTPPHAVLAKTLAPSVRTFKIADNQSPMPQDRVYFTFDYYNNLNGALNQRFNSSIDQLRAYRYIFGLEKTFDEGRGSIGIQLPLDNLTAEATIQGLGRTGGSNTALDDLTVFSKYVLKYNPQTGSLISAGLAVTPRDGPNTFAGAPYLVGINDTTVQPFVGYIWRRGRFYLHGFTALDVPTSIRDVTMVYDDVGIGYYAYRSPDAKAWLSALVPTFEVHVNDPLTHGDWGNRYDPTGTPNVVNLTYGINAMVGQNAVFTFGVVTPVTGPRPFDYEILALFNWRFGRTRGTRVPPPMAGG